MKKSKLWQLIILSLFGLSVFVLAIFLIVRPFFLPVYRLENFVNNEGENASKLSIGDQVYINEPSDFALEISASWVSNFHMIGKTQDGMRIFSIPDSDTNKFIMLTGFMFPSIVYRNIHISPVTLHNFQIEKISIYNSLDTSRLLVSTNDSQIINEVVNCLTTNQYSNEIQISNFTRDYFLRISSNEIKGIDYLVNVRID